MTWLPLRVSTIRLSESTCYRALRSVLEHEHIHMFAILCALRAILFTRFSESASSLMLYVETGVFLCCDRSSLAAIDGWAGLAGDVISGSEG